MCNQACVAKAAVTAASSEVSGSILLANSSNDVMKPAMYRGFGCRAIITDELRRQFPVGGDLRRSKSSFAIDLMIAFASGP